MKQNPHLIRVLGVAVALAIGIPAWQSFAADAAKGEKDDPITEVMKKYHKAPKGTDPVCKRAIEGKATKEELQGLVDGYKAICGCKPPKGDTAAWVKKVTLLISTSEALQKGAPDAAAKYKEAVNCKACHSDHKPEKH